MFQDKINHYQADGRHLVYIDESGFVQDMPRLYGYAPIGQRCYGIHHWKAYGRTNAIGALIGTRLITVGLFQANIDTVIFKTWLEQDLLPKLPTNSVIIMDNAAFHKTLGIRSLIEADGHTLEYLPPYSPDLNPIEKKWAHAKAIKRAFQCSIDDIFQHHAM